MNPWSEVVMMIMIMVIAACHFVITSSVTSLRMGDDAKEEIPKRRNYSLEEDLHPQARPPMAAGHHFFLIEDKTRKLRLTPAPLRSAEVIAPHEPEAGNGSKANESLTRHLGELCLRLRNMSHDHGSQNVFSYFNNSNQTSRSLIFEDIPARTNQQWNEAVKLKDHLKVDLSLYKPCLDDLFLQSKNIFNSSSLTDNRICAEIESRVRYQTELTPKPFNTVTTERTNAELPDRNSKEKQTFFENLFVKEQEELNDILHESNASSTREESNISTGVIHKTFNVAMVGKPVSSDGIIEEEAMGMDAFHCLSRSNTSVSRKSSTSADVNFFLVTERNPLVKAAFGAATPQDGAEKPTPLQDTKSSDISPSEEPDDDGGKHSMAADAAAGTSKAPWSKARKTAAAAAALPVFNDALMNYFRNISSFEVRFLGEDDSLYSRDETDEKEKGKEAGGRRREQESGVAEEESEEEEEEGQGQDKGNATVVTVASFVSATSAALFFTLPTGIACDAVSLYVTDTSKGPKERKRASWACHQMQPPDHLLFFAGGLHAATRYHLEVYVPHSAVDRYLEAAGGSVHDTSQSAEDSIREHLTEDETLGMRVLVFSESTCQEVPPRPKSAWDAGGGPGWVEARVHMPLGGSVWGGGGGGGGGGALLGVRVRPVAAPFPGGFPPRKHDLGHVTWRSSATATPSGKQQQQQQLRLTARPVVKPDHPCHVALAEPWLFCVLFLSGIQEDETYSFAGGRGLAACQGQEGDEALALALLALTVVVLVVGAPVAYAMGKRSGRREDKLRWIQRGHSVAGRDDPHAQQQQKGEANRSGRGMMTRPSSDINLNLDPRRPVGGGGASGRPPPPPAPPPLPSRPVAAAAAASVRRSVEIVRKERERDEGRARQQQQQQQQQKRGTDKRENESQTQSKSKRRRRRRSTYPSNSSSFVSSSSSVSSPSSTTSSSSSTSSLSASAYSYSWPSWSAAAAHRRSTGPPQRSVNWKL